MKVLVPIKRVIDPNVKINILPDSSGVQTNQVKMGINPFDEIALEEAVRWLEQGIAKEVIALSVGNKSCQETLKTALALGASKATHVETSKVLEPIQIARILEYFINSENFNLVIMGKQAIDDDCNQTGQMLAGMLKWNQATFASKIKFSDDQSNVTVTREIDGGLETLRLELPAVITTDLRLNEPRYITLPKIVKAKSKPLEIIPLEEININLTTHVRTLNINAPAKRKEGIKVETVSELVDLLKNKEKVI